MSESIDLATPAGAATQFISDYLGDLSKVLELIPQQQIEDVIAALIDARDRDAGIFVIGNGGSAATASHLAVDLGKGASIGRDRRYRVLSLTDNIPWISALSNDQEYADAFVEQLRNFARKGDVLLAFSGSGNSENILRAVRHANEIGCRTFGFSGFAGGKLKEIASDCLVVPSDHMGRIEDGHLIIQHIITYYLMGLPE